MSDLDSSTPFLIRPRLRAHLRAALRRGHVFIHAAGGYGKTIALRDLARIEPHTQYLILTLADTDLAYLQTRLEPLRAPHNILILDDAQLVFDAPRVLEWLAEQLQKETPRLIFAARAAPPTVLEPFFNTRLDASAFAFSPEEARALMQLRGAAQALSTQDLERAAGWALALDLFARRIAQQTDATLRDLRPLIADAANDLFAALSPALVELMRVTSIPLRFNLELTAALMETSPDTVQPLFDEIIARNLFVEALEPPGWYRYHELIRAILRDPAQARAATPRIVEWFAARRDPEQAIEHALAGERYTQAAQLLDRLEPEFIWDNGRYLTFRRWVETLDAPTRAAHPDLVKRLGRELIRIGQRQEGWAYLRQALQLAERAGNHTVALKVRLNMANAHAQAGDFVQSLAMCEPILAERALDPQLRMDTLLVAGNAHALLNQLVPARVCFEQALALAEQSGDAITPFHVRHSLAELVYLPLGMFHHAAQVLSANEEFARTRPAMRVMNLVARAALDDLRGDWDALAQRLNEIAALRAELEQPRESDAFWIALLYVSLYVGRGELEAARAALRQAQALAGNQGERLLSVAYATARLLRREKKFQAAQAIADDALSRTWQMPPLRGLLALERELAEMLGAFSFDAPARKKDSALAPEIIELIPMRAGAWRALVRAFLAVRCYRAGDARWRKHADAAIRATRREDYEFLLTGREPHLGAAFWAICWREEFAIADARAALRALASNAQMQDALAITLDTLAAMLRAEDARGRRRAAQAFQEMELELALPLLDDALAREKDTSVRAALETARAQLEALPPPLLEIQLLGEFRVTRAGEEIPDDAWHRPIVQRLFQFFALHRREPLARDQILDALWNASDPQQAAVTFRTVFSRLRSALEPHLRPKAPSRYFDVREDVYTFDPFDRARSDAEQFTATIRATLNDAAQHDMPPLPPEFLAALGNFKPLLAHLPLEEWLLEPRERLNALYVEGCLYVAQAQLIYHRLADALDWANKTIAAAPWAEEAYQVLMRAHARMDNRSLALKAYNDAVTALRRELDLAPSPLTEWLAQQLRAGKDI